jgi:hypothetical protein
MSNHTHRNHTHRNHTHYDILGVVRTASRAEIQTAYRSAARRVHPDTGGDAVAMQRLNEAWHVLRDPGRRAAYDATLRPPGPRGRSANRDTRNDPVADTGTATGHQREDGDLGDDYVDTVPAGAIHPLDGWIALLPPATALLAVCLLVGGMVFASPELLVFSGGTGLVALGLFVLAPLLAMSRSRRRRG